MDVNINEIENVIKNYMPNIIIHGHTHRPNVHKHDNRNQKYVLGDWYNSFLSCHLMKKNSPYIKDY